MKIAQNNDSARVFGLLTNRNVLPKSRAGKRDNAYPALASTAFEERPMPLIPNTPGFCAAQDTTDPLIVNARLLNLAAEIDRKLAARRALRPARSAAAKRGWEARNGL